MNAEWKQKRITQDLLDKVKHKNEKTVKQKTHFR